MPAESPIVPAQICSLSRSSLLVALLALFSQTSRAQECQSGWEAFPAFQTNPVYAVLEHDGMVYRGGSFSLFRWNGSDWEIFGGGIGGDLGNHFVSDFTTYEGDLVVGGYFPTAGALTVHSLATWDGSAFGGLGGGVDGQVDALTVYDGDLIAGGIFSVAGGIPARNIARWDGSAWHPLGSGVFDEIPDGTAEGVQDMVVWQGDLYVVGDFTHAGGVQVFYVARWDGSTWSAVGGGVSLDGGGPSGLRGIDVHDGELVIVGAFDFAGGVDAINVASWDGEAWSPVGSGPDPVGGFLDLRQAALSVASYNGLLYVGADFSETVNKQASALAVWDGNRWRPVDHGLDSEDGWFGPNVRDLEVSEGSLLMGGNFDEANHLATDNMAKYTDCSLPPNLLFADGFESGNTSSWSDFAGG